jgi:hypothetical protein
VGSRLRTIRRFFVRDWLDIGAVVVGVLALLASVLLACVAIYLLIHVGDTDVEFPLGGRGLSSIKGPAIVLFAAASIATFLLGRGTAGRRIVSDVRDLRRGETGDGQRWSLVVVVVLLVGSIALGIAVFGGAAPDPPGRAPVEDNGSEVPGRAPPGRIDVGGRPCHQCL